MSGVPPPGGVAGATLELRVGNLDCENDAAKLRRGLEGTPGVASVRVKASAGKVEVVLEPERLSRDALVQRLAGIGFPVVADEQDEGIAPPWRNPKVIASVTSGALWAFAWLLEHTGVPASLPWTLQLASVVIGGYYFAREAIEELVGEFKIGIELLMTLAAVLAFTLGHPGEAAMLAFLYSISEAAEGYTEERTRGAVRALMKLAPRTATVLRDGAEVEVPVKELVPGDVFRVKPGGVVPTDGVVLSGRSSLNQASLTGESVPVEKEPGETVLATSINGDGALEVRATTAYADNSLSRIIHLVEEAQEQKGRSQRSIERFGNVYTPGVLVAALLTAVIPRIAFGLDGWTWLMRGIVLMVAAAPCALAISVPITFVAALGSGARRGILIKGGVHLEDLARVRAVALDKTGTLTAGKPSVTDVVPVSGRSETDLLAVAAAVETSSQHPLAEGIVRHAKEKAIAVPTATDFRSEQAVGAGASVGGQRVLVGKPSSFQGREGYDAIREAVDRLRTEGKTVVIVGTDASVYGLIALRDRLRPGTVEALRDLHAAGVERVIMLTGDNPGTAEAIAREAGIDEYHAELMPEDKVRLVRELATRHGGVAMVGDGVNDAPALAAATVGIAMGAAGTGVALETASVALMTDNLARIADALRLARRTRRLVNQNLALSALVISGLALAAVSGYLTLPGAVIAHELSELAVIANGLRILRG